MIELVDTHTHLNDKKFAGQEAAVIERARENGVTRLINMGDTLASSEKVVMLAAAYEGVYAGVGIHPEEAFPMTSREDDILAAWTEQPRVVAIGEIGLDYHYEDVPREVQKHAFRLQMQLARECSLPVVVHEREAHEDGLKIVDEFPDVTGVFHCFSGSLEMAKELVKRGWYIGFTGVVTFKNARKAVEVASAIPLERILIETDCPYMAPEPFRGRRNDPSLVPYVAAKIAALRGLSSEQVGAATSENARRLFRISEAVKKS